jgi:tRNA pseudouridine55 synthase
MKDGILLVDKPEGLSSAAVVARLKRKLGVKKIGHTGTLDPFATGVLLIAVGQATRISRFFLNGSKAYIARVALGIETDTYDCTGKPVASDSPEKASGITMDRIQEVVARFQGIQDQVPPAYSALKHKGVPLYKLARQGRAVEKPPRQIEIYDISAASLETSQHGLPEFHLSVACSGGTYIRSLAFDIGRALGCGAHLSGLVRTRSSQFELSQGLGLETLESMSSQEIETRIRPMAQCLDFLPGAVVDKKIAEKISYGQKLGPGQIDMTLGGDQNFEDLFYRVMDDTGRLVAIVQPGGPGQPYNYSCVFHP